MSQCSPAGRACAAHHDRRCPFTQHSGISDIRSSRARSSPSTRCLTRDFHASSDHRIRCAGAGPTSGRGPTGGRASAWQGRGHPHILGTVRQQYAPSARLHRCCLDSLHLGSFERAVARSRGWCGMPKRASPLRSLRARKQAARIRE